VVTHISLIQNWFEELKAKVPAGGQAKEAGGSRKPGLRRASGFQHTEEWS
jgi:hypothetical protein